MLVSNKTSENGHIVTLDILIKKNCKFDDWELINFSSLSSLIPSVSKSEIALLVGYNWLYYWVHLKLYKTEKDMNTVSQLQVLDHYMHFCSGLQTERV